MKKKLLSQAGFTITELMVVIAISGILMAVAAVGFSAFFTKFEELNRSTELQKGGFDCLQTIKYGIPIRTSQNQYKFSGISNATKVEFVGAAGITTSSSAIILYPPIPSMEHQNDYIKIFYDGKYVRATYLDGTLMPAAPLYLFPKPGRYNTIEVTRLKFTKADNATSSTTKVVKVELDARSKIKKNVYKTISYTTRMCIAMK